MECRLLKLSCRILTYKSRFLLAQLHLASLSDKTTAKAIKNALKKLPKGSEGLDVAYDEVLERIKAQKAGFRDPAMLALLWIVYAARQLSILELQHALATEDDSCELDEDNLPEIDEVLSACAGLVTVDKDSDVVRLVHYTTQGTFGRFSRYLQCNFRELLVCFRRRLGKLETGMLIAMHEQNILNGLFQPGSRALKELS